MATMIAGQQDSDKESRWWELNYALELKPALDPTRLARAFQHIIHLHPRLRAVYRKSGGDLTVHLLPPDAFVLATEDATPMSEAAFAKRIQELVGQDWDLENGPLIAMTVLTRPRDRMVLLLRVHHLVMDGWSVEVMLRDMMMYYLGAPMGAVKPTDFEAFIAWEEQFLASHAGRDQRQYWRRRLSNLGPRLALPYDRPPPAVPSGKIALEHFEIDAASTAKLLELAKRSGVSLFAILLAGYQVLLSELSGQADIPVTTTTARRSRPEFVNTVGLVANLAVLRGRAGDDVSFGRLLQLAGQTIGEAMANEDTHIAVVAEDLLAARPGRADMSDTAFDQVGFCMLTPNVGEAQGAGLRLKYSPGSTVKFSQYALKMLYLQRAECAREFTLFFNELDGKVACFFAYSADLFDRATMVGLADRLRAILRKGCEKPELALRELKAAKGRS